MSGQFGKDSGSADARAAHQEVKHDTGADATVETLARMLAGESVEAASSVSSVQSESSVKSGRSGPEGFSMEDSDIMAIAQATGQTKVAQAPQPAPAKSPECVTKLAEGFNGILSALSEFSSSGSSRELQELASVVDVGVNGIRNNLLEKLNGFKAARVAANTKQNSKSAESVFNTKTGMRVEFNILGQKISMKADGRFTGDEYFQLDVDGQNASGLIVRKTPQGLVNASKEYNIDIRKI